MSFSFLTMYTSWPQKDHQDFEKKYPGGLKL